MRLFIFNKLSIFTSKVETRFMHEGIKLWISFSSPRRLNTESFFWEGSEFDDVSLFLILAETEGLGRSPFFNLWKAKGFVVWPFPNLLNTEGPGRH